MALCLVLAHHCLISFSFDWVEEKKPARCPQEDRIGILERVGEKGQDIADYSPNPFFNYHNETNPSAQKETLTLVGGGEDGQNTPLHLVIQPVRHVDVVFAVDSTSNSETQKWPSGIALAATYIRSSSEMMNKTSFPYVPGQDTFSALGMNSRPTFFGCNGANVTHGNNILPIIVYLPNSPHSYYSNTSTFALLEHRGPKYHDSE